MKKLLWTLLTAVALLVITACGTGNDENQGAEENPDNETNEVVEENNETSHAGDDEEAETDEQVTEDDRAVIKEEATYTGMQDPHSIEVKTESDVLALQILDPGVADVDFEAIEPDTPVTIEYYQNEEGQNILTNIEF